MGRVQSKRRIALIVEDDAELRLLTKLVLEESELDIIDCDSAEVALATILLRTASEVVWTPVLGGALEASAEAGGAATLSAGSESLNRR